MDSFMNRDLDQKRGRRKLRRTVADDASYLRLGKSDVL
jgi:hypothetical protein